MNKVSEVSNVIEDIRERLAYYAELGVELLDVQVTPAAEAEGDPHLPQIRKGRGWSARECDNSSRAAGGADRGKTEPAKTNVKRPSKLSALPSLSNRVPVNGKGKFCAKDKREA